MITGTPRYALGTGSAFGAFQSVDKHAQVLRRIGHEISRELQDPLGL